MKLSVDTIKSMIEDIEKHVGKSHTEIFTESVRTRLDESFKSYEHELKNSLNYLEQRNNISVLRKMNRMNKT